MNILLDILIFSASILTVYGGRKILIKSKLTKHSKNHLIINLK